MEEASLDNWTVVFSFAAAQGIFLSIVLWIKKEPNLRYLALSMLLFSVMLFYYVAYWTGYYQQLPQWVGITTGLTYLFVPLLYHYARYSSTNTQIKRPHLLPAALFTIYFFAAPYFSPNIIPYITFSASLFQCIHILFYAVLLFKPSSIVGQKTSLYQFIKWAYLGFAINFIAYYILVWTEFLTLDFDYFISAASAVLIYGIGYHIFINPSALEQKKNIKYEKSALSDSASKVIMQEIISIMETDKLYLDNELTLSLLASSLKQSTNIVSQTINVQSGKNFTEFVNNYRIEEAKERIANSSSKPKFIDIAYDVGFNNKTSFYNAFKRIVNISPSEYYSQLQKEVSI